MANEKKPLVIPKRTTRQQSLGRPRKQLDPELLFHHADALRGAGDRFHTAQELYDSTRDATIVVIRAAILDGMHYIDAGNLAGVSRSMAYNVHLAVVADGHEVALR